MKNLYKILFFNTMIIGTLITISSISWLSAWIGLEINLLSIMPLMKTHNNKFSTEAAIKYFIIQAMASTMLLFSITLFMNTKYTNIEFTTLSSLMINSAILMKMGAAPFHFWFPEVTSGLNWNMNYIIMTWQKIAPMILLLYSNQTPIFMTIIIIFSSMISSIQGMNQSCMRKILAYSSINHVSWMISALLTSFSLWMFYFLIYCLINLNIIIILNKMNIYFITQMNLIMNNNKLLKFFYMMNFYSLGGLPPFLGFLPKWLIINSLINNDFYLLTLILIIFTLLSMYMYMRLTFSSLTMNSEESIMKNFISNNFFMNFMNFISLTGMFFCSMMSFMY